MREDGNTFGTSRAVSALRVPAVAVAPAARQVVAARALAWPAWWLVAAIAVVTAIASALVFRDPAVTGDSVYHLIWGRELMAGTLDTFVPGPTPHPLVLALAAATSLLGTQASYDATWVLLGPLALGATFAALFCVGSQIGNRWTGTLAVVTLAVSVPVLSWAATAQYDIAFGALVLWALAAHLARRGRPLLPLALLGVAGLIRPEAWLVAGLYWLWAARSLPWRQRLLTAGVVGAAPVCWMAMDAAVMGDFLYSFHYTESASQELTNQYTRSEHIGHAVADLARGAGFVTLPAALLLVFRRDALRRPGIRSLLALLALTLGIFALLLLDGMPNERYLIVPAYLVILLAARAATPDLGAGSRAAVVATGLLGAQLIIFWHAPLETRTRLQPAVTAVVDVKDLLGRPDVSRMVASCPDVTVTSFAHTWSFWSGRPLTTITTEDRPVSRRTCSSCPPPSARRSGS